jgi:hypothetical protein
MRNLVKFEEYVFDLNEVVGVRRRDCAGSEDYVWTEYVLRNGTVFDILHKRDRKAPMYDEMQSHSVE